MTGLRSIIVLIMIFLAGAVIPRGIPAQENKVLGREAQESKVEEHKTLDPQTQLQVLQSLNQIAVSLTHIITYNDKVVLDQEYNTIINNLNLSKIPDADIITLLQELMDLLTSSKIQDHDRAYLMRSYDKEVQSELKNTLRSRIFDTDVIINPYATLLSAVLNVGSFYFNYRAKMDDYKKQREEKAWKIEAGTLQGLNNFYKKLLKYTWELMRRYHLPDEWRLNEKQLTDYIAILKEPGLELRYRKLERIENSFQKFPPYWYYRGQAAQEIGKEEEALRCFDEFQQINQGILRKDPFAASTAMCKTMLNQEQAVPDEVRKDLKEVLANSDDADWSNILFAALQYARLGDVDKAGRLVLRNLDNGHDAFIENPAMIRTVAPALLLNAKPEVFNRIMDTVLKNEKVKNYDVLWLYGQIRNRDILKRIKPEFDRVMLLTENKSLLNPLNIFKRDNLILYLPTRWMADNLTITLRLMTESGEQRFRPDEMSPLNDFPEITVLTFKNVLSIKKYIKENRSAQIAIALVREKLLEDKTDKEAYDIEMFFRSQILSAAQQLSKLEKYSIYLFAGSAGDKPKASERVSAATDKKEKDANEETLWLAKQKLIVNGEAFQWSDNGVAFEKR